MNNSAQYVTFRLQGETLTVDHNFSSVDAAAQFTARALATMLDMAAQEKAKTDNRIVRPELTIVKS